jgi:hypothetical protein
VAGAALEGGAAGGAERKLAEAELAGIPLPARRGRAYGAVAWLAVREGAEGSGADRGWRGILAGELAVDEAQDPRGAGVTAAGVVDAGEDVLGHADLYYRARHRPPGCTALHDSARVV